jgi:REP-associated tyrosine transposase
VGFWYAVIDPAPTKPHRLKACAPSHLGPSSGFHFSLCCANVSRIMTYYQRRLPHWHPPECDIFITWRLWGSLPRRITPPKPNSSPGATFVHYDRILDRASTGPLWLKDPRVAECVFLAIQDAQQRKMLRVWAYALMANHAHVLLTPIAPLEKIMHQIKGSTACKANRILARTGKRFWQDESFDHWVRNPAEGEKIRAYTERNPVAAGLVDKPEDWPWSSASNPIV